MKQQINTILKDHLNKDVTPTMRLKEDLGCDSLDAVEITMLLEDELSIELDDDRIENWKTVQDIYDDCERALQ